MKLIIELSDETVIDLNQNIAKSDKSRKLFEIINQNAATMKPLHSKTGESKLKNLFVVSTISEISANKILNELVESRIIKSGYIKPKDSPSAI